MATAEKKDLPVIQPYEVILTLTQDEATTLEVVLGRVGGCPDTSRRKYASAVWGALRALQIRGEDEGISEANREIYFER